MGKTPLGGGIIIVAVAAEPRDAQQGIVCCCPSCWCLHREGSRDTLDTNSAVTRRPPNYTNLCMSLHPAYAALGMGPSGLSMLGKHSTD